MNETQRNIKQYKAALPGLRERIAASAMLLLVSLSMVVSASFAWYTISTAPEVSAIATTVAANGNLEIALVGRYDENGNVLKPDDSRAGDSSAAEGQTLVSSNITWGNLVNLSDHRYGLNEISLRPALLSGYNLTKTPLYGATYASDGRIVDVSQTYEYASWTELEDGSFYFAAGDKAANGVRAIASVTYTNVSGDAAKERLQKNIINAYSEANNAYVDIITGVTKVDDNVTCMDALMMLVEKFVNEKAANVLGSKTEDYGDVVTYMYRLIEEFEKVLLKEGNALLMLANMQVYLQDETSTIGTEYFKSVDDLMKAYDKGEFSTLKINLESMKTYRQNRKDITAALDSLRQYAEDYDLKNPNRKTEVLPWTSIGTSVDKLVKVTTAEINGLPMSKFSGSNAMEIISILNANSHTVVLNDGSLKDTEQRLFNHLQDKDIRVSVHITEILDKNITNVLVKTAAKGPFLSNNDQGYTFSLTASGSSGDATAQDTYGMAIDMWVRTNAADSTLRLEGALRYSETEVPVMGTDKNGVEAEIYDLVRSENPVDVYYRMQKENGSDIRVWYYASNHERFGSDDEIALQDYLTPTPKQSLDGSGVSGTDWQGNSVVIHTASRRPLNYEAYQLVENVEGKETTNWYDAVTHLLIGDDDALQEEGFNATLKMYYPVIGFEGPNRVWMDWEELIEAGYMPENSTTQGTGSCYVFYADPTEQTRILELLKAFSVAFIDQDGTYLASARLDTDSAYAINGKVTVPLVMSSGATYLDEEGNEYIGIIPLEQNKEMWITAIVYLDGMMLTNEQVLSAGEIEGRLNIQFGSSVDLDAGEDRDLQKKYMTMTATATYGDVTSGKESERITFEYDGQPKKIEVTVMVDGDKPNTMNAFFIRSIGKNQGNRMEAVDFTDNHDGTWSAEFVLTKPGLYSLRSVIADGVEYELEEYPTVFIEGLSITSVVTPGFTSGMIMSADSVLKVPVEAVIDADEELQPKNVRALFTSADGKEYTAQMSYDALNKKWVGTANIRSSGTFTLRYLVMDGQPDDVPASMQITLITKLGLRANIWCTNSDELPLEYMGPVNLNVRMKIQDDSGAEIQGEENVWLYYLRDDSPLEQDGMDGRMTWNNATGYYEGSMTMESAGNYLFNRIVIKNDGIPSTIGRANAPTFTVMPSDPPEYDGFEAQEYQFTAGQANAKLAVNLKNAQTATVWGLIENLNTNQKAWVRCVEKSAYGDNAATYYFVIPTNAADPYAGKQDGEWKLTAVAMQGVYIKDEGKMYSVIRDDAGNPVAPNLDDKAEDYYKNTCYVFDTTNVLDGGIETYVVQTVNVKITKPDAEGKAVAYTGSSYGGSATNKTGAFMQSYTESGITITISDWNGQPLENMGTVTMNNKYDGSKADDYGGYYSGTNKTDGIASTQNSWAVSGSGTTYIPANQTFQFAGSYTVDLSYQINGTTYTVVNALTYNVFSAAPTVKITGATTYSGSSRTETSATVTFNESKSTTCGMTFTNYSQPNVDITLSGYGNATGASLKFDATEGGTVHLYQGNGDASSKAVSTYTWTGDGSCKRWVGFFESKSASNDTKTPAGELKASILEMTYGGTTYKFDITTITINNPK